MCVLITTMLSVTKRKGHVVPVKFEKIQSRITGQTYGLNSMLDVGTIARQVIVGMYDKVKTSELDELAAEIAASMSVQHPDYGILAARIAISNHHKETKKSFYETMKELYQYYDLKLEKPSPKISLETWKIVQEHRDVFEDNIVHARDMKFDFFGFKTLMRSYLIKCDGRVIERIQHMYMRVAIGIHGDASQIERIIETYNYLSQWIISHASPTMFNAGTPIDQMSSCFLLSMKDDSITGIYETLQRCAEISKTAGGIGLAIHDIRAKGTRIAGTNGESNGIVPMLRVFNATARYVDQGGNKRPGAFAVYMEPWHADVFSFLDLRKNTGVEEIRARDLFYALWIPDLFMERVRNDDNWTLMCPRECPGLSDCWGQEFEELYTAYEKRGKGRKTIRAQELWFAILQSQSETGTPYMLYKDACNRKSNQQNLGTIKCSNLCTEIVEYTSPDEIAVCNIASVVLPQFLRGVKRPNATPQPNADGSLSFDDEPGFDFQALRNAVAVIVQNLNSVIDRGYSPLPECKASNDAHRPIGIGVQGLADVFAQLRIPFDSEEARKLNHNIFETIYYAALEKSCKLAKEADAPYSTYEGSPISKGLLQQDLWILEKESKGMPNTIPTPSGMWDWDALRAEIKQYGVRNSLLTAPMPTASTAQILNNTESFEPRTNNAYTRRVLSGEFQVVNPHLIEALIEEELWDERIKQEIIANNGSVQVFEGTPEAEKYPRIAAISAHTKAVFKTVWEISQKVLIDLAAERGVYIDQSQSFNVHIANPNSAKLSSMHFYGWENGLKTGMYYLRTRAAASAIQFTVDKTKFKTECTEDVCISCQ